MQMQKSYTESLRIPAILDELSIFREFLKASKNIVS